MFQILMRVLLSCWLLRVAISNQCIGERYDQHVAYEGCQTEVVKNLYCGGTCPSGFVQKKKKNSFTCSACRPTETKSIAVTLFCQGNAFISINVTIFQNCQCTKMKCKINDILSPDIIAELTTKTSPGNHPCRMKCRKCRKAKRKYKRTLDDKLKTEYMMSTCRTESCKARIQTSIFSKVKLAKEVKRYRCKKCNDCKRNKKT